MKLRKPLTRNWNIFKKILIISITFFTISCSRYSQKNVITQDDRNVAELITDYIRFKTSDNENVLLGFPDTLGFIIERQQYVISYCGDLNSARWVSWFVDKNSYGVVPRYSGNFRTERTLPLHYTVVRHSDYTRSGYDRGHIVRSKERTQTVEDNIATFYLTNVIPQKDVLNRGIWSQFENYCERLAKERDKQLFIIAGGWYPENPQRINNKIAIPDSCWKVVLILCNTKTINCIDTTTQIIAVMMPNDATARGMQWQNFLTTAKRIEQATGFNFFATIPPQVKTVIEKRKYKKDIMISF